MTGGLTDRLTRIGPSNIVSSATLKRIFGIDTAQLFNQDNYKGKIKEVCLDVACQGFRALDSALDYTKERGYTPINVGVVNKVTGNPDKNEPVEAIWLSSINTILKIDGLIVRNYDCRGHPFLFYDEDRFRFIE